MITKKHTGMSRCLVSTVMSKYESVVADGVTVLRIELSEIADFNNKRHVMLQPGFPRETSAYSPPDNYDYKKIKNPNFGKYEGNCNDVSRYGWPDKHGSVWVPSGPGKYGEQSHWDIEYLDGSHENFFPTESTQVDEGESIKVTENALGPILIARNIMIFSVHDKELFLGWIAKVRCIEKISSIDDELCFHIISDDIFDSDLDDLIGLFIRYKIDAKQLKRFLTDENRSWFYDNKIACWHKQVFNNGKRAI
jgi:hypothetical protein